MERISLEWILGAGFSLNLSLLYIVWKSIEKRLDKIDEKVTDIDRRLCRLEGAFSSKDCCMIKDHRMNEKAE